MAKLTDDQVRHVAKLANLILSDEEINKFSKQLSNVLDHIEVLSKVDTTNTEPTSQVTGITDVYREDKIDSTQILTDFTKQFVVKAVINKDA